MNQSVAKIELISQIYHLKYYALDIAFNRAIKFIFSDRVLFHRLFVDLLSIFIESMNKSTFAVVFTVLIVTASCFSIKFFKDSCNNYDN